ncbi:HEPN domain-containing protein [Reyranella sp.]|jgi:hypothetical protein|uniref:HEPN domain-containing protein n=1 Tax=Reyranella sp. TaxID=1929291 RepID=UPI00260CEF0B|nr:HEPN domain-containing protein [Reyranella sp.]HQS19424.1 HEPN domain-containing protein [Reyranella sp.]HQT15709.1 HEPN domain-containing protein [Reyranella sp.]
MIPRSNAFATYRELSQAHINFVVLVCHAVPALRADLATPPTSLSNAPDYFKPTSKTVLNGYVAHYRGDLGRTTLVAIFSYFESYVKEVLSEIISFHGGAKELKALALARSTKFLTKPPADILSSKRKLQEPAKKELKFKYQKHSKTLDNKGFKFPSELLAHFGVVHMLSKADEKRGMRAWDVPDILADCLLFPLSATDRAHFERVRSVRNKIAHGKKTTVTLEESLRTASELHALASKIDNHLVEHFFVLQTYV